MNQPTTPPNPATQPISGFPMLRLALDIFNGVWKLGGPPPKEFQADHAKIQTMFYTTLPDKGIEVYATPAEGHSDFATKIGYRFFIKLEHIRGTSEYLSFGLADSMVQGIIASFGDDEEEEEEEETAELDVSREAWQAEIEGGETELGYRAWAAAKLAEAEIEPEGETLGGDDPSGDQNGEQFTNLPPGAPAAANGAS